MSPDSHPSLGVYVHVPFCAKECEFCAFYKEKADRSQIDMYIAALVEELKKFPPPRPVDTVFMGGGTPTLLTAKDLEKICGALKEACGNVGEWTIECAPGTLKKDKLEALLAQGVNRFSLGVQSFNERTLSAIGRPHTLKQAEEAMGLLKTYVKNWNIDLIFVPGHGREEWKNDLERAISCGSQHISTYCLTFESDTELYLKMRRGEKRKPTPEEEAEFYLKTWEILKKAGFHHYEVSNFARKGFECRHNLNTWAMGEWLGYGPSAAGQFGGTRRSNIPDLLKWAEGIKSGKRQFVDESALSAEELALDRIIFGLRMPDGIDMAEVGKALEAAVYKQVMSMGKNLTQEGLMEAQGNLWRLTERGLLVADSIGAELLSITERKENSHTRINPEGPLLSPQETKRN